MKWEDNEEYPDPIRVGIREDSRRRQREVENIHAILAKPEHGKEDLPTWKKSLPYIPRTQHDAMTALCS